MFSLLIFRNFLRRNMHFWFKINFSVRDSEFRDDLISPYQSRTSRGFTNSMQQILLEKLIDSQPVKKFPSFYVIRKFSTAFTSARHLSLSWARSIQSMCPIPLPEDPSKYHPPIYIFFIQVVSFLPVTAPKTCVQHKREATVHNCGRSQLQCCHCSLTLWCGNQFLCERTVQLFSIIVLIFTASVV